MFFAGLWGISAAGAQLQLRPTFMATRDVNGEKQKSRTSFFKVIWSWAKA